MLLLGSELPSDMERLRMRYGFSDVQLQFVSTFRRFVRDLPHIKPYAAVNDRDHYFHALIAKVFVRLGEYSQGLEDVPVGLAILDDVNACVVRTPSLHMAILVNNFIFAAFPIAAYLFYEYLEQEEHDKTCESDKQRLFHRITNLSSFSADALVLEDDAYLMEMNELFLMRPTDCEMALARLVDELILLHEYGHIVCKHLDDNNTCELNLNGSGELIPVFCTAFDKEYLADAFAAERLFTFYEEACQRGGQDEESKWLVRAGILNAACLLFGMMELKRIVRKDPSEVTKSHPRPWTRWTRLRSLYGDFENTLTNRLAVLFEECITKEQGGSA